MTCLYRNSFLQFQYPEGWEVEETQSSDALTISVQSPGTMFCLLTLFEPDRSSQKVADQALKTMREEYPALESAPVAETMAKLETVGHDISFFSLDLTNTCWIRAFESDRHTTLIFAQTSDIDLELNEQLFRAICASIELHTRA